jgi:hypothetical protein
LNRRKLFIENLNKIEGMKISADYIISKVASQLHWIVIFVTDIPSDTILEVRIKRESDNTAKPYRWTMKYGNLVSAMYKSDFETPAKFLIHLEDLIKPLPF